jgi:hypothetical protein
MGSDPATARVRCWTTARRYGVTKSQSEYGCKFSLFFSRLHFISCCYSYLAASFKATDQKHLLKFYFPGLCALLTLQLSDSPRILDPHFFPNC